MGSDGALPSAQVGIELVSDMASYIDFTSTNVNYKGRIEYDSSANNMLLSTNSTAAININSAQKTIFNCDRINIAGYFTPASASDTGTLGDVCYDNNYFYVCVGTNTWKRSALTTW